MAWLTQGRMRAGSTPEQMRAWSTRDSATQAAVGPSSESPAAGAGFTTLIENAIDEAPGSRVALLSFAEDQVITRFFFSAGNANSWLTPPYATYTANLVALEAQYDARPNSRYFRLPGQEHVMLQYYGVVLEDGGISAPRASPDGGTDLKAWIDAWATGTGAWNSQR